MSEEDQSQPTGQEQTRDSQKPQGERSGGGRHGRRRHGARPQQQQNQSPRRSDPALNMDELRELMELFTSHGLTDFEFENEDIRVRLSKNAAPVASSSSQQHAPVAAATSPASDLSPAAAGTASASSGASPATAESDASENKAEDLHIITSPIVGTFYRSPSPDAESFVRAGSHVEPDTVVCIIEAMKLMNEIQAETTGTVEKVYVENGQPVEYGQPLFGVKR